LELLVEKLLVEWMLVERLLEERLLVERLRVERLLVERLLVERLPVERSWAFRASRNSFVDQQRSQTKGNPSVFCKNTKKVRVPPFVWDRV
jgi:hypothetical protein